MWWFSSRKGRRDVKPATDSGASLLPVIDTLVTQHGFSRCQAQMGLGCLLALLQAKLAASAWQDLALRFPESHMLLRRGLSVTRCRHCSTDQLDSFLGLTVRLRKLYLCRDTIFTISSELSQHLHDASESGFCSTANSIDGLLEGAGQFLHSDWYDEPALSDWLKRIL